MDFLQIKYNKENMQEAIHVSAHSTSYKTSQFYLSLMKYKIQTN